MDMSGGAAVLEAVSAIAELGLPLNLIAVVPSTENMPSGHAIKPGDIITQLNGKTVEVNNTDAEGRLILADALDPLRAARGRPDRRSRDAHRRRPDRARLDLRGADLQRRRIRGRGRRRGRRDGRARLAPAAASRVQGADQGHRRRPHQRGGEAQGRNDLRRLVPRGVRRGQALGPPRHRRHRLGRRPRIRRQGRERIRRQAAGRARPRALNGLAGGCRRSATACVSVDPRRREEREKWPASLTDSHRATLRAICDTVVASIPREPDPTASGRAGRATWAPTRRSRT